MAKAETPSVDPRTQLAELEKFVAAEKAKLIPAVKAAEDADRAKAEAMEAEKLEALKGEAAEAADYLLKLAARIDTAMRDLAELLQERAEAGAEFARQYDRKLAWVGHTFSHAGLVDSALHHAGVGRFAHVQGRGALSLEYVDRQRLGGLVK